MTKPLHMLGLGMSVGTPTGGITADVAAFASLDDMTKAGRTVVAGKIVLLDVPYEGYGKTVRARVLGASMAASLGAVGVLVRSITPLAMQTPHTGTLVYDERQPKIPAAAVSPEDGRMLTRLTARWTTVKVRLDMQARREADVDSFNVMGEIVGSTAPEEVVVLGGSIDSWDVGQAHRTTAAASWRRCRRQPDQEVRLEAAAHDPRRVLGQRRERRRRRKGLPQALGDTIGRHVAAIEMDGGAEAPIGYGLWRRTATRAGRARDPARRTAFLRYAARHRPC